MIKDIKYYMSDTQQSFEDFIKSCDDMINSKYILADGKISAILQHIASSKKTYALFEKALSGFDFGYEFSLAKQPTGYNTETVRLPKNNEKAIAFTFCLLLELDMGQRKLKDFLHIYFYNENPNTEYASFIREIIVPFKEAAVALFYNAPIAQNDAEERSDAQQVQPKQPEYSLESLLADLNYMADRISRTRLADVDREELTCALSALNNAVAAASMPNVRLSFIAFKNTLRCISECEFLLKEVAAFGEKLISMGLLT